MKQCIVFQGHGKTETAKQLSELLECPFLKVDCRNHANPWEMFGAGTVNRLQDKYSYFCCCCDGIHF